MAKNHDNTSLLPHPYKEEEDIVICRVTEQEIEDAFSDIVQIEVQRKRKQRSTTVTKFHPYKKSKDLSKTQPC